ncbi:MAG: phospho-N-acetylmuramoyl-pentapeptide-transferase [Candidatus Hydrothermales bacterium]
MILEFIYPLKIHFSFLNLLGYVTFRAAYAAVTSFFLTLFLMPYYINLCYKFNLRENISEDVPAQHRKKEGTPTSGGIIIVISVILSLLIWGDLKNIFLYAAILPFVGFSLIGFIDDLTKRKKKKGLSQVPKFILQVTLTLFTIALYFLLFSPDIRFKTQMLFFKNILIPLGFVYPLFLFYMYLGTINSVNLTDGLDGLAIGVVAPIIFAFTVLAYTGGHAKIADYLNILFIPKSWEITVFGSALLGSSVGFLWFNSHPAEIFMGDTGSHALGAGIASMAALTKQELLLPVAGFVLVIEAMSVIIQVFSYRRFGKRVFLIAPIHHHFEKKGIPESKIVIRFWILSLIFSLIAVSTLKIR